MNSAANSNYGKQAEIALNELDSEKAEQMFLELVVGLEEAFNKNQKDVAAELQRIAKEIESLGKVDDSLRFKQRTCEIMLRRSMAERRKNQQAPAQSQAKDSKLLTELVFASFVNDPHSYSFFLQRTELCSELKVLPDGSRFLRSKNGQLIFLSRAGRLSGYFPLFIAGSRTDATRQMQDSGHFIDGDDLEICGVKLTVIKDKAGQRFLVTTGELLQSV